MPHPHRSSRLRLRLLIALLAAVVALAQVSPAAAKDTTETKVKKDDEVTLVTSAPVGTAESEADDTDKADKDGDQSARTQLFPQQPDGK